MADGRHCEDGERTQGGPGRTEPEDGAGADYGCDCPGGGKRDGAERERADHVERAHPGQGLRGYPLLRHGRFERAAQRRSQPGQQCPSRHGDDGKVQGQRERREGEAERGQVRDR